MVGFGGYGEEVGGIVDGDNNIVGEDGGVGRKRVVGFSRLVRGRTVSGSPK